MIPNISYLDATASSSLFRPAAHVASKRNRPNMCPAIRGMLWAADSDSFQLLRNLHMGPWAPLKFGQKPHSVRDTAARRATAHSLGDSIERMWHAQICRTVGHPNAGNLASFPPGLTNVLREGAATVIASARDHGAITHASACELWALNRGGSSIANAGRPPSTTYVDGRPYATWDAARAAYATMTGLPLGACMGGDVSRFSRFEWPNRPGYPCDRPLDAYHSDTHPGASFPTYPWCPVREPKSALDREALWAVDAICKAFYRLGRRMAEGCNIAV